MTSLAHSSTPFELRTFKALPIDAGGSRRLKLLPSGDGWSLVGPSGELVFEALGTRGRRECLEYARAHGVLAIFS
jgi:hypothetical protein